MPASQLGPRFAASLAQDASIGWRTAPRGDAKRFLREALLVTLGRWRARRPRRRAGSSFAVREVFRAQIGDRAKRARWHAETVAGRRPRPGSRRATGS
jgi:hypothetical protein